MGYHGVPSMPVYVYKAILDEISPVADTDTLVERYCGIGANILYQRIMVRRHLVEAINGQGQALAFLNAILDGSYSGTYKTKRCTIQKCHVGYRYITAVKMAGGLESSRGWIWQS